LRIHMAGKRHLDEDAIDFFATVQAVDDLEEFAGGDAFWRSNLLAVDAQFLAGLDLVAHIDGGAGIFADEHHSEAGRPMRSTKMINPGAKFRLNLFPYRNAVQQSGHVSNRIANAFSTIRRDLTAMHEQQRRA